MADISFTKLLPRQIVKHYIRLKSVTSKIQRTTSSIAFTQKALYYEVTTTFAKVKGQFIKLKDQGSAEKKVLHSHFKDNRFRLRKLLEEHSASAEALRSILKSRFFKIIYFKALTVLGQENTKQLICKNKKLLKIKFNKSCRILTRPRKNLYKDILYMVRKIIS